jgi:hypothetical protein
MTKLWASCWENDYWESYSPGNLLGERVAGQVISARVAIYVEPPSVQSSLGKQELLPTSSRLVTQLQAS